MLCNKNHIFNNFPKVSTAHIARLITPHAKNYTILTQISVMPVSPSATGSKTSSTRPSVDEIMLLLRAQLTAGGWKSASKLPADKGSLILWPCGPCYESDFHYDC
jgi:hypothetical protein